MEGSLLRKQSLPRVSVFSCFDLSRNILCRQGFRLLRLKDENLLDLLISKSMEIAISKGLVKSKTVIIDAAHTYARYNLKPIREVLLE